MNKIDIFTNPINIFIIFILVSLINIISSIYFAPIMLASIVFLAFMRILESKYYYSLFWISLTFLIIENTQGFGIFSLLFLAYFIYLFIKPNIENLFSSHEILKNIYIFIFYILLMFIYIFFNKLDDSLLLIISLNLLLDMIIVGLFL